MFFEIEDFIAGSFGGIAGLLIGQPFDTIKVRQQFYARSLYATIRSTFRNEGIRGFYKGLPLPLLVVGPSNSIFFGVYGNCLNLLNMGNNTKGVSHLISPLDKASITRLTIAASVASLVQLMLTNPVELVKITLQVNTEGKGQWKNPLYEPYMGTFKLVKEIYKKRGVGGFYRGLLATAIRDVPTGAVYMYTYEMLLYSRFQHCSTPDIIKQIVSGGTAGFVSILIAYPVDVVKTRMQADNPVKPKYFGVIDCFRKSYHEEGYQIFFKGMTVVSLRAFPVHAATFVGYEFILLTMNKKI